MDWQDQIIALYLEISSYYQNFLCYYCERFSNNSYYQISDEELITIYLFSVIEGRTELSKIYYHVQQYWLPYFPTLPSYVAFVQRINRLSDVFIALSELYQQLLPTELFAHNKFRVIDSMPIVMAAQGRRFKAQVAPQVADKGGYCSAKKLHYYGVKLHIYGCVQPGALPVPEYVGLTSAGTSDIRAYEQLLPDVISDEKFADKAYVSDQTPGTNTFIPIKKEKGQAFLDAADQLYSTAISRIRQPIESFNNWLQEKTNIQKASKVRSEKGLIVHVFGKLTAAFIMLKAKFNS